MQAALLLVCLLLLFLKLLNHLLVLLLRFRQLILQQAYIRYSVRGSQSVTKSVESTNSLLMIRTIAHVIRFHGT